MSKFSSSLKTTVSHTLRGMRLIAQYIPHLFLLITCHAVVTALTPYITLWLFAQVFDHLLGGADASIVWVWTAAAVIAEVLLALLGGILKRHKEMRWEWLYRRTDRLLMDALLAMDPATAADPEVSQLLFKAKENMTALGAGLVRIPDIYQRFVSGTVGLLAAAVCACSLFASADVSPLCRVSAAVLWCALVGGTACVSAAAQRKRAAVSPEVVANDRIHEDLLVAAADKAGGEIAERLHAVEQAYFSKHGIKRRLAYGGVGLCEALAASLAALWWGIVAAFAVMKAIGGAFGFGSMAWYIGAAMRATQDAADVVSSVHQANANAPCLETVFRFLDVLPTMYVGSLTTEKRADNDYELTFDHVCFRYPGQTAWALYDISFTLRGGQTLAVVGKDGSGKSTLAKLLCRLYDPTEGTIYLNGIDVRKYRPEEYRALVSAAFGDSPLFDEPLGVLVAGTNDFDAARVTACLAQSGFNETVSLHELPNVTAPSHHEILAARALYKDCPFVVFDDIAAVVDVSHRAAVYTTSDPRRHPACDDVLVLCDGCVAQRGTHTTLIADEAGEYYALWQA